MMLTYLLATLAFAMSWSVLCMIISHRVTKGDMK